MDFIGTYLRLEKAGASFRACCPFHGEKTPSFFVSPARQIWHCFGCGKGGDVFKFFMEIEGQEFPDALRALAERTGVELKKEDTAHRSERQRLYVLHEAAAKFFESKLIEFQPVLDYLRKRGLEEATLQEFRLGFAPDEWRELSIHLKENGFSDTEIEKSGLVIMSQTNRFGANYYDRFRGRIMFPICDQMGKVIAFGGRIFTDKPNESKYINSPETQLYQKSKILYGLNKSKTEILQKGECIVVEGYMDMIMSYQAGVKNIVASSGTALTADHIKILKRFCDTLIAAFDMDLAGEGAAKRGIDLALGENFDIRVVKLNGVKDPADAVLEGGNTWQNAVAEARHIVKFYIDSAVSRYPIGTSELSKEIQKSVLPVVSSLGSELERAHWIKEVASMLNIKEEIIWSTLKKSSMVDAKFQNTEYKSLEASPLRSRKELLEDRVLGMIAIYPNFLKIPNLALADALFSAKRKPVFAEVKFTDRDSQDLAALGRGPTGEALKDFISRLMLEAELFLESLPADRRGMEDVEAEFLKCQRELEREYLRERLGSLGEEIRQAEKLKLESADALLLEFRHVSKKLSQLHEPYAQKTKK